MRSLDSSATGYAPAIINVDALYIFPAFLVVLNPFDIIEYSGLTL